jgi:hypothetical protein
MNRQYFLQLKRKKEKWTGEKKNKNKNKKKKKKSTQNSGEEKEVKGREKWRSEKCGNMYKKGERCMKKWKIMKTQ